MPRADRLGIRGRLFLVVATTLALFTVAIAVVFAVLSDVNATYERLLDVDERILLDATRLRVLAEKQVSLTEEIVAPAAIERLDEIDQEQNLVIEDIALLVQTPQDKAMLTRIRDSNVTYDLAIRRVAEAFRGGRADTAVALFMQLDKPRDEFLAACDALITAETASRDVARAAARRRFWETLVGLVLALAVGGAAATGVALAIGGRIAAGVVGLAAAVRRIAAGELGTTVATTSEGELSALAADVDALRRSLLAAREAEALHRRRVELVRDVGRDLLAASDLASALGLLAERTGVALGAIAVQAALVDARDARLVREAAFGEQPPRVGDAAAPFDSPDGAFRGEVRVWYPEPRLSSPAEAVLLEAISAEAGLALRNAAVAEVAQRRADELDRFVHVVAHDVRGPVAMAQRLADLIRTRNPILAASEAPLFARIGDATAYAEGLIDDLRELVRVGRVTTRREPVELARAVAEAGSALATIFAERGLAFETAVEPGGYVSADPRQLRQVLTNLLENAAHHMGDVPAPRVRVEAERVGDWWRIAVMDNGKGIPAEARTQVFVPFRRLGRAEDGAPGMGMGLAIARRIAEAHGGSIWVDDTPGGGCAVYFTMAAATGPAEVEEKVEAAAEPEPVRETA